MLWFTCFLVTQVQGGSTLFIFNSSFLFCFFTTLVHLEIMSVAEGRCRLYMGAHAHKLTRESAHGFCWRGFPLFLFFFFLVACAVLFSCPMCFWGHCATYFLLACLGVGDAPVKWRRSFLCTESCSVRRWRALFSALLLFVYFPFSPNFARLPKEPFSFVVSVSLFFFF